MVNEYFAAPNSTYGGFGCLPAHFPALSQSSSGPPAGVRDHYEIKETSIVSSAYSRW